MAKIANMMSSGLSPRSALTINGGNFSEGGLKALGTNKATALVLAATKSYISVCSSGVGVSLPAADQGDKMEVFNGGANALLVYTPVGSDTFTNLSANAGFTVSSMKGATFDKVTGSLWMLNYSK